MTSEGIFPSVKTYNEYLCDENDDDDLFCGSFISF